MTGKQLEPHQQRVVEEMEEKDELDERIKKLDVFLRSSIYLNLPTPERSRLSMQRYRMGAYSEILGQRIDAFS